MQRPETLERLRRDPLELLVIGGGIIGARIAFEAARRGLSVALVGGRRRFRRRHLERILEARARRLSLPPDGRHRVGPPVAARADGAARVGRTQPGEVDAVPAAGVPRRGQGAGRDRRGHPPLQVAGRSGRTSGVDQPDDGARFRASAAPGWPADVRRVRGGRDDRRTARPRDGQGCGEGGRARAQPRAGDRSRPAPQPRRRGRD